MKGIYMLTQLEVRWYTWAFYCECKLLSCVSPIVHLWCYLRHSSFNQPIVWQYTILLTSCS